MFPVCYSIGKGFCTLKTTNSKQEETDMIIRTKSELKIAYEMILMVKEIMQDAETNGCNIEKAKNVLVQYKQDIRNYYKRQDENSLCIVKDYGIDGYIELFQFPENVKTIEDAKEWFDENERKSFNYTAYDCTGQAFTGWEKIFVRNGKFYCYHRVCYDV